MKKYLIVGAGFAGAVFARELAESGARVNVIDKRNHIAGNAFDYINESGLRIHKYGPHLFHTNNKRVVKWLSNFTEWVEYSHKVRALLPNGILTPLPVSLKTINDVFSKNITEPLQGYEFLKEKSENISQVLSAEDHLFNTIGKELTNLFLDHTLKRCGALICHKWMQKSFNG